jgi:hypothetical protein
MSMTYRQRVRFPPKSPQDLRQCKLISAKQARHPTILEMVALVDGLFRTSLSLPRRTWKRR